MKLYGASICSDCVFAKTLLDSKKIKYHYVDVTESVANMKEFLQLRDTRPEFEQVKKSGRIGIPTFLFSDGRIEFDVYNLSFEEILDDFKEIEDDDQPGLCGLDGC